MILVAPTRIRSLRRQSLTEFAVSLAASAAVGGISWGRQVAFHSMIANKGDSHEGTDSYHIPRPTGQHRSKDGLLARRARRSLLVFKDSGAEITLASPKGGRPPLDPKSNEPEFRTDLTLRFEKDAAAQAQLDKTVRLDSVNQESFDTVFYPGGHGPMWDLAEDKHSIKLIESFLAAGKPIAIVCHSTGALRHVKTPDGKPLVRGKEVTGLPTARRKPWASPKWCPFLSKMRC